MTAAVASPPISVPDVGSATAAKTAAAAPETGDSFGAMLSQLDAAADPSTPDAGKSPDSQVEGVAFADAAALAAAMSTQMPWMAQLDAAKTPPPKQDVATPPAGSLPQALPEFGSDPSLGGPKAVAPQAAETPTLLPDNAQQTPSSAATQANSATPVVTANVTADEPLPQDDTTEPAPTTKLAVPAATHPKDEKTAHLASDASPSVQPDVSALTELSSPLATQILAVPASSAPQAPPQPTSAPVPGSNPAPEPQSIPSAELAAAAQATPGSAGLDKTGNSKSTPASAAKANSNTRTTGTRDSHAAAPADSSPAAANASDASDRPVKTTEALAEHGTKSEAVPLATALPQASPAPSPAPNHAAPDLSVGAVPTAPPAPSIDSSTTVRLSFATPAMADVPSFDALALKIAARNADGENNFSIRLDPPELGRIEVNLNVNSDGHAQANLSADKPQTLELLQKDASALERALKDAGLNLAGGMTFSLKGDGRSQAWRDMQNAPRGRNLQIAAVDAANANAAITTSAALAAQAYGLPVALLDIRV